MIINNIKKFKFYLIFIFLLFILFFYLFINNIKEEKIKNLASKPILINLLTSVHPNLNWNFIPVKQKINIKPGEVNSIEYVVENLSEEKSTGIATFAYYPKEFGAYISKINCFCYDAQTLSPNEKNKFILVVLLDPEVTKDSKTKDIKEVTIQFTFFDYKDYKEKKS